MSYLEWMDWRRKVTWKFLCTQVTKGSFETPFARACFGPFAIFSGGEVSGSLFTAWASFSRISTSSFSKKFKNSWASYMKKRDSVHSTCIVLLYSSHVVSDQSPDSQLNEQIPGAYSFGKAHFVFSISVQNALEQWHLFSSSVNLSTQRNINS